MNENINQKLFTKIILPDVDIHAERLQVFCILKLPAFLAVATPSAGKLKKFPFTKKHFLKILNNLNYVSFSSTPKKQST